MAARQLFPEVLTALAAAAHERAFLVKQRRRLVRIAAYHRPPADVDALLAAVRRKTLVFTITAGRTGTTYLQSLLAACPDTTSLHEPEPAFVSVLRMVQHEPDLARRFLLEYKLPFIAGAATARYAEVSHLLCKGFLEPLLELGVRPGFVVLRRSPQRIAASYLQRRTVPGRSKLGLKYLVHPGDPGVLPLPQWTRRSAYQLCFWYALEIERRQAAYSEQLAARGIACVDVTAEELHDSERFLGLVRTLGLLAAGADLDALRRRHRGLSAVTHNANPRRAAAGAHTADEEAVWSAIAPAAPELRAQVERRYAPLDPQACASQAAR
ncbi:MAG: hypothetical protein ABI629_25985 [bacterium]